jgi:tetratricopeptide (TPR) repeat protein
MGEAKTALLFFDHAARLAPENEEYQAAALGAFCEAHPDNGKIKIEKILDDPQSYPAAVIVRACEIRFQETLELGDERRNLTIYKQIVHALHIAIMWMQKGPRQKLISEAQPIYSVVCSLLATCCRNLGMIDPAFHYYTTAIGLDPLNPPLLIARGAVLYGQSGFVTEFAIQDFMRAIRIGTDIGIPYYFLAHYYLLTGQYKRTLQAVVEGLGKEGGKRLKSEMMEYRAIALAALSFNTHATTEAFQEALKIDETNYRAKTNLEVYENTLKEKLTTPIEQRWLLKIDPIWLARELPRPLTLQESYDAHWRMAG